MGDNVMKTNSTALLGAAIGAGLLWLIKKNKNQPKGAIDPEYLSYEEIKKEIDLNSSIQMYDSHHTIAVGKNAIGYYVVFTHYGLSGKDHVTARYITSETYMKLRTEDGIPETTEDIAVSGIGAAQGYASKNRILSYFDYPDLIDEVLIDLTERKGKYVDGRIYFRYRFPAFFWISKEDARWLSELCDKYDVEFSAWNGNTYIPSLHKKIAMDFATETERLPRI